MIGTGFYRPDALSLTQTKYYGKANDNMRGGRDSDLRSLLPTATNRMILYTACEWIRS